MLIYVNNQLVALKKGISFGYVSENRMFSGTDGYTLTITFPLRGCPENKPKGRFWSPLAKYITH